MSDLIDRQKALDGLKYEMKYGAVIDQCGLDTAYDIIENMPSAEPEPKKGKWVPHPGDEDWDVCSVCGTGCKRRERGISQYIPWVTEYNYQFCPNCGAEMMRGEE